MVRGRVAAAARDRQPAVSGASKGHIVLCVAGELHTELADGRSFVLTAGMSYQVADGAESHRSSAPRGARLFIVD
jgi:hypothetical protein